MTETYSPPLKTEVLEGHDENLAQYGCQRLVEWYHADLKKVIEEVVKMERLDFRIEMNMLQTTAEIAYKLGNVLFAYACWFRGAEFDFCKPEECTPEFAALLLEILSDDDSRLAKLKEVAGNCEAKIDPKKIETLLKHNFRAPAVRFV